MKSLSYIVLAGLFIVSIFVVAGCSGQGQTAAELRRERIRSRSSNLKAMYDDLEMALMIDEPSRLSDKKLR